MDMFMKACTSPITVPRKPIIGAPPEMVARAGRPFSSLETSRLATFSMAFCTSVMGRPMRSMPLSIILAMGGIGRFAEVYRRLHSSFVDEVAYLVDEVLVYLRCLADGDEAFHEDVYGQCPQHQQYPHQPASGKEQFPEPHRFGLFGNGSARCLQKYRHSVSLLSCYRVFFCCVSYAVRSETA